MALFDIEVDLSEEASGIRDTVHKFAEEVMRPAGAQLDRLGDPADVIARNSILWPVFEKYRELGIDAHDPPVGDLAACVLVPSQYFQSPTGALSTHCFAEVAVAAAAEAMASAGELTAEPERTGTFVGSGVGGIETLEA